MNYSHYSDIDWRAIYKRLVIYGQKLASRFPDVFDGISGNDLAGEALLAFFAPPMRSTGILIGPIW